MFVISFSFTIFIKQWLPLVLIQNKTCREMASVVTNTNKLKLVELNRTKYADNRKWKRCPKNFQVLSTQWPGLHKRTCFDPSCINRLRFSWAGYKKIRKLRYFRITMARLMLLLLLIAQLTLTSYADSGQKVIKLKNIYCVTFSPWHFKVTFRPAFLSQKTPWRLRSR